GFPYRLVVTTFPQIENASPRAVQAGQTTELTFFGRNLGTSSASEPKPRGTELPLDAFRTTVSIPGDFVAKANFGFIRHPTDHSTLPTAATCTLVGLQVRTGLPNEVGPPVPLIVTSEKVTLEVEPNNQRDAAQHITIPAIVSGRFDEARDADWYEVEVGEAGNYSLEVY